MSSAKLSAARLVEQLQLTNERLERLEAEIRHVSGLPSVENEIANAERGTHAGDQQLNGHAPFAANGSTTVTVDHTTRTAAEPGASDVSRHPDESPANHAQEGSQTERSPDTAVQVEAYFRRADVLFQSGKVDAAVKVWRQLLEIQPDNLWALTNIGIVYTDQGRWSEAYDIFTQVARLEPESLEAHYGLGLVHAQQGNYRVAAAEWEYVLRLQPDNEDARVNLSIVNERMAQEKAAADAAALLASAPGPAFDPAIDDHAVFSTAAQMVQEHHDAHAPSQIDRAPVFADPAATAAVRKSTESEAVRRALVAKAEAERRSRSRQSGRNNSGRYAVGFLAVATVAVAAWFLVPKLHTQAPATSFENPPTSHTSTVAGNPSNAAPTPPQLESSAPEHAIPPRTGRETTAIKPEPPIVGKASTAPEKTATQPVRAHVRFPVHSFARRVPVFHRTRTVARRPRPAVNKPVQPGFNNGVDKLINQIP